MPSQQGKKLTSVIDTKVLAELSNLSDDPGFLPNLIKNYLQDTKKLFKDLEVAIENPKLSELDDLLHAMKGSAVHIGSIALSEHVTTMRTNLEKLTVKEIFNATMELKALIAKTEIELITYIS